jgi:uncharacterized protein with NAD-binding domain and iron-sulfur cluster
MQQTVAILGGGVAGFSAAHELAERGFAVRVYERKPVWGGKARSIPVTGSARDGDGTVRGILSVDISEWQAAGVVYGKSAQECTAEQIKEEVWTQLKQHLNVGGAAPMADSNLVTWFLDPDIEFPNPGTATNAEPLLINTAGSLQYRPEAQVELQNLFVASDYVRTYTDIACMEAANEAARRAVNCLLLSAGSTVGAAQLWPLEEPAFLKPLQEVDRIRVESAASFGLWRLGPRRMRDISRASQ